MCASHGLRRTRLFVGAGARTRAAKGLPPEGRREAGTKIAKKVAAAGADGCESRQKVAAGAADRTNNARRLPPGWVRGRKCQKDAALPLSPRAVLFLGRGLPSDGLGPGAEPADVRRAGEAKDRKAPYRRKRTHTGFLTSPTRAVARTENAKRAVAAGDCWLRKPP